MTSSRMTTLLLLKIIDVLDVFNFCRVPPLQRFGLTYVSLLVKQCTTLDTDRRWVSMSLRLMIFTPGRVLIAQLVKHYSANAEWAGSQVPLRHGSRPFFTPLKKHNRAEQGSRFGRFLVILKVPKWKKWI